MPRAAGLELHRVDASIWRAVEAQHIVSTMRLVDNDLNDQRALEDLIETVKPPLAAGTQGLHWLLAAPFRYPTLAAGSRFRAPADPGVFYGGYETRSACAEAGYWRWRFVQESAGLTEMAAQPMSLFQAAVRTEVLDLTRAPYAARRAAWVHPADYSRTQAIARKARAASAGAIVYESVRDPKHGRCMAVLTPGAFPKGQTPATQTWYLTITLAGSTWSRAPGEAFSFVHA